MALNFISMLYLLLGKDDFSKREFLNQLTEKEKLEFCSFAEGAAAGEVAPTILDANLFGGKKLVKLVNFFSGGVGDESFIEKIQGTSNIVVFFEDKLDKRKSETKKILNNKNLKVLEFEIPAGAEFKKWVVERAKKYGLKLSGKALDVFLQRMGIVTQEGFGGGYGDQIYSLWQADAELQKLKVFAGDDVVTEQNVLDLVSENVDENIFKITNAIGDKNKPLAVKYLTDYMDRFAGVDEKTKVITLSGLLAEQFRNILMVQGGVDTGFAPGKMFVYKKLAGRFTKEKTFEALRKLELLDQEVKTTSGPAALQFFMIIDGVLK